MNLMNELNLILLLSYVKCFQEWDDTQQLVYQIGNQELSEVFIHFDNQTLEMSGNKDLFKCVKNVREYTLHCIDTIAIQWQIKGVFLTVLKMNANETQKVIKSVDKYTTDELSNQSMSSEQLICCVLSELFDCMEYTIRKECNDNSFDELKQIHNLIAKESYSCQNGNRTQFCDKMLRQRQQMEDKPKTTSGEKEKSIQFLLIMFHFFIFFIFNKCL